ncbi:TolC family protein [bacterium]|nr:TolC family protein [bacterium]
MSALNRYARGAVAAWVALAVAAPAAWAQGPVQPLTLDEAMRRAIATSELIQGAEAKASGAAAREQEIKAQNAPTVSVSVMPMHLGIVNPTLKGALDQYLPGMSPNALHETLTVSQVLYDGGRTSVGAKAAKVGQELAAENVRNARQTAAYEAANAYLNVLRAESLLSAANAAQRQTQQHVSDSELREKKGIGSRFELLQAKTALANAEGKVVQAQNAVELSRLSLSTAMHEELGNRPLEAAPSLAPRAVEEAAIAEGIARRPEVRMAQRQEQIERLGAEIKAREKLPVAAAQGIVVGMGSQVPGYAVLGTVNWTLFDGGKTDAKVKQGEQSAEAAAATVRALQNGLRLEVQKAIADRREAQARIKAAETGLATAKAGYELARVRFKAGVGSGTEAIDAATMVAGAQAQHIQAVYDEVGAELRLAKALGIDLRDRLGQP